MEGNDAGFATQQISKKCEQKWAKKAILIHFNKIQAKSIHEIVCGPKIFWTEKFFLTQMLIDQNLF